VDPDDPSHGESVLETRVVSPREAVRTLGVFASAPRDSFLKLDNVRTEHYSTSFVCRAWNKHGQDEHTVRDGEKKGEPNIVAISLTGRSRWCHRESLTRPEECAWS